ncbi:transcriptional antiterminator BglB [Brachyspira pilosicoli B2904]|uniref:Transcriptional antiterminator BglB n=1 Tax=Brachyspira pilosicoli B2904 TaxID=1133568 RepID=J9UWV0_BRAPL|nr:PRD domain-containing protein [Brachyspira pilosicoli]AFR71669.1 transcriptional antiterminator BglB [Brachyspira pilosicoli B2904]
MKSKYIKELLSILSNESYITAEMLAKKLQISEKTVRIKIAELNKELENTGIKVVSKARYGYILECDNHKDMSNINLNAHIFNDFEYRLKYIFEHLINNNNTYIKSDNLISALDISKTTLTNTLKIIEDNIRYYNLKIERKPNYGIKLIGKEFDIRNCIIDYYLKQQIYDKKYINKTIENIVINFIKKNDIKLSEVNLENFISYISVSIERIKENKNINDYNDDSILKDVKKEELKLARKLANILEKELNIKLNDTEIIFIAIHIASKSLLSNSENYIIQNKLDNVVQDMLDLIYNNLKIDLRDNLNLRLLLNHHMIPLDIRIRYNVLQKNPMLSDIKTNYSLAYLIASEANTVLKTYYNKEISDDEIGFLALLFQIALEENSKRKKKINILIVCGSGKTTSKLLMHKYKKEFADYIENIYTTDLIMLKEFDFSKVDYIFSTVPIVFQVPVPIVHIGLFLETNDIIKVKNVLDLSENDFLNNYYNKKLFSTNITGNSREEIIKNICKNIKKYINIPDNFYDLVMKRESLSETDFGNLVAIPHPFEIVTDETFVFVAILEKPIIWYKNNVQVVFLVSISNKKDDNLQKFYQYTVDFLLNEKNVIKLIENRSFENLMYLLKNSSGE